MASPLNPERHSEILGENSASVEIKVQFVIGRIVNHDMISVDSIMHFLTP